MYDNVLLVYRKERVVKLLPAGKNFASYDLGGTLNFIVAWCRGFLSFKTNFS